MILVSSVLPLLAQERAGPESPVTKEAKGRVAWLAYTSLPKDLENPVTVMTDTKITPVTLSARMVSGPIKIPADGIIRIVRKVPNLDDPEKSTYLTLAQAFVPDGVAKALVILILLPKPKDDLVFRTQVQDLTSFTGGDNLYMNLTDMDIAVELGKTALPIKPGQTSIFHAPTLDKPTNVPVRYSYFQPIKKKWQMISASTVALRSTRREICIFSWDLNYGRIDYRGITFPVTE